MQIVQVAGYIAYKVVSIGKGRAHRTEDLLLQVLTFGVIARALTAAALWYLPTVPAALTDSLSVAAVAGITALAGGAMGTIWRVAGEPFIRWMMNRMRVYTDDHESSVWESIMNYRAKWTVVQVHIDGGRVLEANFGEMVPSPKVPIIINEDGIAMYVTGSYDEAGVYKKYDIAGNEDDTIFTYIPRAMIKQMDVAWRV
ncbi:hypothetical protein [Rhizobium mongolense]|uniref:hypothetical protein n=1 Tax=Rhizobium mongolense TaxID=57676 RepID=UPI00160C8301|nr:hypothetical protein [Rhizobium mongolense]